MTAILPWLGANWLMLAIALAFLIFLVIGISFAVSWYFWTWVIQATEPEPLVYGVAYGDVPQVPEKAKRRAA